MLEIALIMVNQNRIQEEKMKKGIIIIIIIIITDLITFS